MKDLYELERLIFYVTSYRASYLSTFNNYYLQKYIQQYIKYYKFKFYFMNKYKINLGFNFLVDISNNRIILKE